MPALALPCPGRRAWNRIGPLCGTQGDAAGGRTPSPAQSTAPVVCPQASKGTGLLREHSVLMRQMSEVTALLQLLPAAAGHRAWQSLLAAKPGLSGGCAGLGSPLRAQCFSFPRGFSRKWIIVGMGRLSQKCVCCAPPWHVRGGRRKVGLVQVPHLTLNLNLVTARPRGMATPWDAPEVEPQ